MKKIKLTDKRKAELREKVESDYYDQCEYARENFEQYNEIGQMSYLTSDYIEELENTESKQEAVELYFMINVLLDKAKEEFEELGLIFGYVNHNSGHALGLCAKIGVELDDDKENEND